LRARAATSRARQRFGAPTHVFGEADCFIAEGLFAIEMAAHCRDAGMPVEAICLDRPGLLVMILRFAPLPVLIRRGWALQKTEPELRRLALDAGFRRAWAGRHWP
jgi:uridine kinase